MVHIYSEILLSHKKNHEIVPLAATWMDLDIIILRSQTEKDKYHMISLMCGIYDTNEPIYKTEIDSQTEQPCGCQRERGLGGKWIRSLELADGNYYI